jgi:hypothetical protein
VASAVCLLVLVVASIAPAQEQPTEGVRPEVFRGSANALGVSVAVDRDALLPINDLFKFTVVEGTSIYESSAQSARSSLFFPGNGLIQGANLLCGTFLAPYRSELGPIIDTCLQYKYPLTVFADEFAPDGQTSGALQLGDPTDPVSGNAVRATAHAAADGSRTDAAIQDLRVLGLPAIGPVLPVVPGLTIDTSVVNVDSATARTNQRIEDGALVIDSSSIVSGISLVGGLIRIGAVRSVSHITDDPLGEPTASSDLEVSGVTVAGIPSQITEDGLVVGTPSGGLGPIVQQIQIQVNELLRALGVKITILTAGADPNAEGGPVAFADGLLLEVAQTVTGLPTIPGPIGDIDPNGTFVGSVQIGRSAAKGQAFAFDPDAEPPTDGGITDLGLAPTDGTDLSFPDLTTPPTGPQVEPPGGDTPDPTRSIGDIFDDRLAWLYLALAFAALGLCVAPRFALPARLPGAR